MHRLRLIVGALVLVFGAVGSVKAQTTTGALFGDVSDLSGAILPGATVRITNESTGATREIRTNEIGAYRFSGLVPALYTVAVEFPGFRSVTRPAITVAISGEVKVDFQLEVGQINEFIMVTEPFAPGDRDDGSDSG